MARAPSGSGGSIRMHGRVHLARHRHRHAQLGGLRRAGVEGAVDGGAQAGVAQHRRDVGAEGGAGGGVGAARLAVGAEHQQRVGQALDDRLVGAQQPADLGGAGGEACGPAARSPARSAPSARMRGAPAARDSAVAFSCPAWRSVSASRIRSRANTAAQRDARPAAWRPAPAAPAPARPRRSRSSSQQRRRRNCGDRRGGAEHALAAHARPPSDAGRARPSRAPARSRSPRRARSANRARPRRTVPSACNTSNPSTPANPSGRHSAAKVKSPSRASTRPIAAAS